MSFILLFQQITTIIPFSPPPKSPPIYPFRLPQNLKKENPLHSIPLYYIFFFLKIRTCKPITKQYKLSHTSCHPLQLTDQFNRCPGNVESQCGPEFPTPFTSPR